MTATPLPGAALPPWATSVGGPHRHRLFSAALNHVLVCGWRVSRARGPPNARQIGPCGLSAPRSVTASAGVGGFTPGEFFNPRVFPLPAKATFDAISKTYSYLTPDLWKETVFTKSPYQVLPALPC